MDAYKKAIELDGSRVDYYQSYGLFCISINKYDEAEGAYNEAAEIDESMSPSLYSEFAIEYYNNVMATYGEIMEDPKAQESALSRLQTRAGRPFRAVGVFLPFFLCSSPHVFPLAVYTHIRLT